MLELLEHEQPSALSDHEAVALAIERARRGGGTARRRREGAERVVARDHERGQGGLGAAGEHRVGAAVADGEHRGADRVGPGRARGAGGEGGSMQPSARAVAAEAWLVSESGIMNGLTRSAPRSVSVR